MSRANPLWGAPRVHGELAKLGISISQAAVSKYMVRHRMPPSHTWRSFLDNHVKDLVSLDFFTLPTAASPKRPRFRSSKSSSGAGSLGASSTTGASGMGR